MSGLALTLTFDGHRVRMVGTPERPEWIAKDVCRALSIHHTADALRNAGITADERGSTRIDTPGGPQDVTTITEPGLWKLVMASRKPAALRFKHWLAEDVLPCIRRYGCYPAPVEPRLPAGLDLHDPKQLAVVTLQALQLVAEYQPKAEALDRLSLAKGDVGLQESGRLLGLHPNLFVSTLIDDGLLFRGPHGKPTPYAQWLEAGYFRVVMTEPGPRGLTFAQTLVTPLGMTWLAGRYRAAGALATTSH